jgi:hypothetical protein
LISLLFVVARALLGAGVTFGFMSAAAPAVADFGAAGATVRGFNGDRAIGADFVAAVVVVVAVFELNVDFIVVVLQEKDFFLNFR